MVSFHRICGAWASASCGQEGKPQGGSSMPKRLTPGTSPVLAEWPASSQTSNYSWHCSESALVEATKLHCPKQLQSPKVSLLRAPLQRSDSERPSNCAIWAMALTKCSQQKHGLPAPLRTGHSQVPPHSSIKSFDGCKGRPLPASCSLPRQPTAIQTANHP